MSRTLWRLDSEMASTVYIFCTLANMLFDVKHSNTTTTVVVCTPTTVVVRTTITTTITTVVRMYVVIQ